MISTNFQRADERYGRGLVEGRKSRDTMMRNIGKNVIVYVTRALTKNRRTFCREGDDPRPCAIILRLMVPGREESSCDGWLRFGFD